MYIKLVNGEIDKFPYNKKMLRQDNPNTSFPKSITDELLVEWEVYPVIIGSDPEYNIMTQKLVQPSVPLLVDGVWVLTKEVVELTQEEIDNVKNRLVDGYVEAVQRHLDITAQSKNYDNILSLCSYATSNHVKFSVEGQSGVEWRDACWSHTYQVLDDVNNGVRIMPSVNELIAELPVINW